MLGRFHAYQVQLRGIETDRIRFHVLMNKLDFCGYRVNLDADVIHTFFIYMEEDDLLCLDMKTQNLEFILQI